MVTKFFFFLDRTFNSKSTIYESKLRFQIGYVEINQAISLESATQHAITSHSSTSGSGTETRIKTRIKT